MLESITSVRENKKHWTVVKVWILLNSQTLAMYFSVYTVIVTDRNCNRNNKDKTQAVAKQNYSIFPEKKMPIEPFQTPFSTISLFISTGKKCIVGIMYTLELHDKCPGDAGLIILRPCLSVWWRTHTAHGSHSFSCWPTIHYHHCHIEGKHVQQWYAKT